MQQLSLILSTTYLVRPLVVLLLLSVSAGIVGTIVNLRTVEFRAEAMVHSVFPGIVIGFVFGGTDAITAGACVAAAVTVVALTNGGRGHTDIGTAVVLTSFYSFGIVVSLYCADKSGQLEALMFGRVLEMNSMRMWHAVVLSVVGSVVVLATWRAQIMMAFDPKMAQVLGVRAWHADLALNIGIACVVIAGASVVGVLLVVGFLVVPAVGARGIVRGTTPMAAVSVLSALVGSSLGFVAMLQPTPHPVSPQAAICLSLLAVCALLLGAGAARKART